MPPPLRRWSLLATFALLLGGALTLVALPAFSRTATLCSVSGYVTDQDGRALADAQVMAVLPGGTTVETTTDASGAYSLNYETPDPAARVSLYAQASGEMWLLTANANFASCRAQRNLFTGIRPDLITPGPTVPAGLGVPPPYPPPPRPTAADPQIILDSRPLTAGLSVGEIASLPICLYSRSGDFGSTGQVIYRAHFDPGVLRVLKVTPMTGDFETVDSLGFDNLEGQIVYAARSEDAVALPTEPSCRTVATVDLQVLSTRLQANTALVISVRGTAIGMPNSTAGAVTRTTTYIDVRPSGHTLFVPVIIKNATTP